MYPANFIDQMGERLSLPHPPKRIISLVPSQTELLSSLGLEKQVIGITKFCFHPKSWTAEKTIIGGTKKFHFGTIQALQPDLIIGNKEENYQEGINILRKEYPVWMSDIFNLDDACAMMQNIGSITGTEAKANEIVSTIKTNFGAVKKHPSKSVLYLIWQKPYMAAGTMTFIDEMLTTIGLKNVIRESRYPELSESTLPNLNPDYIFLSSEPYPFKEEHKLEIQQLFPQSKIILVDGEMFSWYGSRLIYAPEYFNTLKLA